MYLTIIFLPLFSFIASLFFGKYIGSKGAQFLTCTCLGTNFILAIILFFEVCLAKSNCLITLGIWFDCAFLKFNWGFLFDPVTSCMLIVINFISFLVHLYSIDYMAEDPHIPRFMSYLSLFTFFMILLVTANNLIQLFVGWEGVGVCSFLLINFWYSRLQANKAAIKAMMVNRVGDIGIIIAIVLISYYFGTVEFYPLFSLAPLFESENIHIIYSNYRLLDVINFFLLVGVIGKSAQFGLHTWLPDAMEGPTPVSALIHAATMVTAGVFLIVRCSHIFELTPAILNLMCYIGSLTCFFAASVGLVQNDMKKVIAYSTCSQLGYMVFICGLSCYNVSFFHLVNHAFFKALLFLGAGSVIHALQDEQDMRKMGGLRKLLPFTYSVILIGSLSLMGIPFLSGFYSKDLIIELSYCSYSPFGNFCFFLGCLGAFLTAFYSLRLLCLVFLSDSRSFRKVVTNSHESSIITTLTLSILIVPSIFSGIFFKDMFVGFGTDFWGNSLFFLTQKNFSVDLEFLTGFWKQIPFCLSLLGSFFAFFVYSSPKLRYVLTPFVQKQIFNPLYNFLNKKWFVDRFYNEMFVQTIKNTGNVITYKNVDRGLVEIFGPTGAFYFLNKLSLLLRNLQTGNFFDYINFIFLGFTWLLVFFFFFTNYLYFSYDYCIFFNIIISLLLIENKRTYQTG